MPSAPPSISISMVTCCAICNWLRSICRLTASRNETGSAAPRKDGPRLVGVVDDRLGDGSERHHHHGVTDVAHGVVCVDPGANLDEESLDALLERPDIRAEAIVALKDLVDLLEGALRVFALGCHAVGPCARTWGVWARVAHDDDHVDLCTSVKGKGREARGELYVVIVKELVGELENHVGGVGDDVELFLGNLVSVVREESDRGVVGGGWRSL
ncbi:hypothetical protein BC938DRAFT_481149 [Jimgerdemannia flammicorona]|uniref:Uncharacterized protein n=1 Tax=Jimgerdemannia flammicorona TaxID=994334 RepID=A0A433QGY5_9FUNG|nr:hypothetical protein BC938DRAFT_481149 [Jimgerdemannia flammicorona]